MALFGDLCLNHQKLPNLKTSLIFYRWGVMQLKLLCYQKILERTIMLDHQLQAYYTWYNGKGENNWQYNYYSYNLPATCSLHACTIFTLFNTVRIAESTEQFTVDYTGQICQFSEIGPAGTGTTPRPWICFVLSSAQWQWPNGSAVTTAPSGFTQATGSELYQVTTRGGPALIRGPDYNSPDGEYCCVIPAVPSQRRCVTLSE